MENKTIMISTAIIPIKADPKIPTKKRRKRNPIII